MSCTENDSGPFVVFFLPALVGCLTILLARRWAHSQVSSTSSTAVSRRRKIIKDPLIKRPLPTIACKMMPPGPKKTSGISKKSPLPEEEMNGKRVSRTTRLPSNTPPINLSDIKLPEGPIPPKHMPFPYIPQDGTLLFESMSFMFVLLATGLQFLNLYRTAWWLPNSNTNQAMNFYLIDIHLVTFIIALICRRFLLCTVVETLKYFLAPKLLPHAISATRLLIFGMIFSVLMFCLYSMLFKYPLIKTFFLCYPAVIYFFLFGLTAGPFLELYHSDTPPLHCCFSEPEEVRTEVDTLRQDFNMRVKKIIFNSILEAYYSSFIPCCFAQSYLYYDVYACMQQTALVCGGAALRYAAQLLPAAALDTMHRAATHLACWTPAPLPPHGAVAEEWPAWSGAVWWGRGARVRWRGALHVAARSVAAEPANTAHTRFYAVFSNPSTLLCFLLSSQLALIVLQLCLLFSSLAWHNFIAIVLLLFINYYTLFKLLRDYLIAFKVYKAESMIQDKNNSPLPAN